MHDTCFKYKILLVIILQLSMGWLRMQIRKGINMVGIKRKNRVSILNILRGHGAMPRKDIAKQIQLTPASVTIIVNKMIEEGIIKEIGELEENDKRAGRKKILIDINYDIKYVIGVSIESQICSIAVANIKEQLLIVRQYT